MSYALYTDPRIPGSPVSATSNNAAAQELAQQVEQQQIQQRQLVITRHHIATRNRIYRGVGLTLITLGTIILLYIFLSRYGKKITRTLIKPLSLKMGIGLCLLAVGAILILRS